MKLAIALWGTVMGLWMLLRWLWHSWKTSKSYAYDANLMLAAVVLFPAFVLACVAAVLCSIGPVCILKVGGK